MLKKLKDITPELTETPTQLPPAQPEETHFLIEKFKENLSKVKRDNNIKVTLENDWVRVSELTSGCARKLFYRLSQDSKSKDKENFDLNSTFRMNIGSKVHEYMQETFGDYLENVEERFFCDELKVSGQIDGAKFNPNNPQEQFLVDFKIVGVNTYVIFNKMNKAKKDYKRQMMWYIYLYNQKYNTNITKGYLFFVNRNVDVYFNSYRNFDFNTHLREVELWKNHGRNQTFKIFEVNFDEEEFAEEVMNLMNVRNRVVTGKRPPKVDASKKYMCENCVYKSNCYQEV